MRLFYKPGQILECKLIDGSFDEGQSLHLIVKAVQIYGGNQVIYYFDSINFNIVRCDGEISNKYNISSIRRDDYGPYLTEQGFEVDLGLLR